jgi:hypothetical protein
MKPVIFAAAIALASAAPGASLVASAQTFPPISIQTVLMEGLEGCISLKSGGNEAAMAQRLAFGPVEANNTRWKTVGGRNVSLRYETAQVNPTTVLHNCGVGIEPPMDDASMLPRVTARAEALGLQRRPDWTTTQGGKVTEFSTADSGITLTWVRFEPSSQRPKGMSLLVYSWVAGR